MTADRIWIGPAGGGRMTNQAMNMELQQAQRTETRRMAPGIKYFYDVRDLLINFFGDGKVAVACFYWYQTAIIPADTPLEIQEMIMSLVQPTAITHVLMKEGKDWKIAHTHVSFLNPIPVED